MRTKSSFQTPTYSFSREPPPLPEKRLSARQLTIYRVGVLIVDSRRELCLIRNISAGGVRINSHASFSVGHRVTIEFSVDAQVTGTVRWIGDGDVGVEFDEPIDVEEMLARETVLHRGWKRRLPRIEFDRMGILRVGAISHGVNARDISQGGVALEIDQKAEISSEVVVTLDGLRSIHGVVRWADEGVCGMSFNHSIPFRELMSWVRPAGISERAGLRIPAELIHEDQAFGA